MSSSNGKYNRPNSVRPKNVLLVGPNTKESIFDSRWVTAHQGSHWWASRLNTHGHCAATYDMNLQPGENPENPEKTKRIQLDDLFKRGMPGKILREDCKHEKYDALSACPDCGSFPKNVACSHKFNLSGKCSICFKNFNEFEYIWEPYTDLHKLFTLDCLDINDESIVWKPWDIIGFSILDATIEYDIAKIIKARALAPQAILVGGGSQATLNYQTLFDKSPLDMVVLGQDPFAMLNIANEKSVNLFKPYEATGIVLRRHAKPVTGEEWTEWIDELDFEAMHQDLYWQKTACLYDNPQFQDINTFRLFMHNFCPVNCAYCTLTGLQRSATGMPTKAVGVTGEHSVVVIKRVMEKYPKTHQIFFCDDDFMLTPQWERGFTEAVIAAKDAGELPKDLGFICLTNINRLDDAAVERCARAGFRVLSIGVESVSQWKLNSMNKPQTPERIWKVTESILRHGIKPYYTLLIHTPYERPEDMVVDINGFRRMSRMGVGLSIEPYLMPLHGTIFYEADVPTRYKVIPIEGSRETVKKGTAWMPVRPDSSAIFLEFEKWFPRFKKWRYASDGDTRHKEKNYYSHVILDAQELVLKKFFPHLLDELGRRGIFIETPTFDSQDEIERVFKALSAMGDYDVDSVGALVKRKSRTDMTDIDFSHGRVDVRDLQRRMSIEVQEEERISSVDSSEQLKEKKKQEEHSVH